MNECKTTISAFDNKGSMEVTLRRPSILTLAMSGRIPNPLLSAAAKLFDFAPKSEVPSIKEIGQVMHIIAEATLVCPTYDEVKDDLTDEQLLEIYHYAKEGADGLEYFRLVGELHKSGDSSDVVQHSNKQHTEN